MYDILAKFYQRLTPRNHCIKWKRFARPIIQKSRAARIFKERKERPLCVDAGCGTGELADMLAAYYDVIGIDISPEMLDQASRNYPDRNIMWVQQDISKMNIGKKKAAAIFATTDSLNHILLESKLNAFLKRAYDSLESGGYLFFDVITEQLVDFYRNGQCAFEDFDWGSFFWTCNYDLNTGKLTYDVSCFEKCENEDDIYIRTDDRITERIWSENMLFECLDKAGFKNVQVYGDISCPDPSCANAGMLRKCSERLYYVCEKSD